MKVSIVILAVDMLEMTKRCVELIKKLTPPVYELVIVADECQPEMLTWLKALEAKVITNPKRVGVPTAFNMGIGVTEGKYIAWLNNDISVTEGWLEPLITVLQEHPDFGWVASKILRGNLVANFGVACSLFSKEALDKVGLLDERFSEGEGWDDNDLLLRFWRAGYQPHGVSRSVVYHPAESATFTALYGPKEEAGRDERSQHNLKLFIEKWGPGVMNIDWVDIPCIPKEKKAIKFFFEAGPHRGSHVFKWLSPNNSGRWGNVLSVDDISEAEYVVVYQSTVLDLSNIPPERILLIQHEPDEFIFAQHMWDHISPRTHKYPLSTKYAIQEWDLGPSGTYDNLKGEDFPPKTKDLSWVTTNFGDGTQSPEIQALSGHKLRMQFLQNFIKKFPDKMDLYGRRLEGPKYDFRCNKGQLYYKWEGIKDYRYTFAFENAWQEGWVTEKLSEGILAGCMPIYWGCPNLEDFLPEGSFIRLDIAREDAPERATEIVNSDYREKHLDALREAKELILDKYNIWPSLHRILNELERKKRGISRQAKRVL